MGNISGYRGIAINILPGTDIESAVYKAFFLSGELECEVVFNFNGCWLNVGPGGMSKKEAVQKYFAHLQQSTRIRELEEAASELVHLHMCEMEGLSSGQPTPEEWIQAVDALTKALRKTGKETE